MNSVLLTKPLRSTKSRIVEVVLRSSAGSPAGGRDIRKVRVANLCHPVPFKHRIDCLRKLRTTRLIDAARVHPDIFPAVQTCDSTCVSDLGIPLQWAISSNFQVLKCKFFILPSMRKNCIRWDGDVEEFLQLKGDSIEKPHAR